MVKIGIYGACGKMGIRIATLALKDKKMKIVSAIERPDHPMIGKDLGDVLGCEKLGVIVGTDPFETAKKIDCMIDFTLPVPTMEHLSECVRNKTRMVIGTTGCSPVEEKKIKAAAKKIAIVFSPNMSVGVNLVFDFVAKAAKILSPEFSMRIDETHHVHKKDSPSGTAKMIARVMKEASGKDVPIEAFREGEVVGNHGIIYESPFETIEIRHDAKTRDIFVVGALKAAKFISARKKGIFNMADVLDLK
ncbi:MAG TPA: 4-hydroxy-tetrahydrodipicolinate reductase [Candidatus Omnitrophota bacterium]|nr:4-hydroxy-tetrahydrodipicolinate reductase [Candidatus Omnitrophota bacterium]